MKRSQSLHCGVELANQVRARQQSTEIERKQEEDNEVQRCRTNEQADRNPVVVRAQPNRRHIREQHQRPLNDHELRRRQPIKLLLSEEIEIVHCNTNKLELVVRRQKSIMTLLLPTGEKKTLFVVNDRSQSHNCGSRVKLHATMLRITEITTRHAVGTQQTIMISL